MASISENHMKIETNIARTTRGAPVVIIGDIGVDLIMGPLETWPANGTEMVLQKSEMRPGGSAGNAAIALAALNADVSLFASIGSDAIGAWLQTQFADVNAHLERCEGATSISVGILHPNAERTFLTSDGHLARQSWTSVAGQITAARDNASTVLLTAPFLLPQLRRDYAGIIIGLRGLGYRIAIDTGWPPEGFTPSVIAEVKSWLSLVDHVLLNELEITSLAGTTDLATAMAILGGGLRPDATLVAKVGAKGAIAVCGYHRAQYTPAANPEIFDTVGAGDAFNAGYLFARACGTGLDGAIVLGCETATQTIAHFPRRREGIMPDMVLTPAEDTKWPTEV